MASATQQSLIRYADFPFIARPYQNRMFELVQQGTQPRATE
jgi:hypothetical protein